jgi:hypothetical protein
MNMTLPPMAAGAGAVGDDRDAVVAVGDGAVPQESAPPAKLMPSVFGEV